MPGYFRSHRILYLLAELMSGIGWTKCSGREVLQTWVYPGGHQTFIRVLLSGSAQAFSFLKHLETEARLENF